MRTTDRKPLALFCADLHLSHQQPASRGDADWYAVMGDQLDQLAFIEHAYKVPVFCAGDVFDRWNSPPELINFAIARLPGRVHGFFAIPGQHDLPYHAHEQLHKSAYDTLVLAGACIAMGVIPICFPFQAPNPDVIVHAFPWNATLESLRPAARKRTTALHVALVHKYLCTADTAYPGAPDEAFIEYMSREKILAGYDVIVSGDNHRPFAETINGQLWWNCGGFLRRRSDEYEHQPRVGLLWSDGTMSEKLLDTSQDVLFVPDSKSEANLSLNNSIKHLVAQLAAIDADNSLDFEAAIRKVVSREGVGTRWGRLLLETLDELHV